MRNLFEIILAFFKGAVAFGFYALFTPFLIEKTHKYTLLLYDLLEEIPCHQGQCKLRYVLSLAVFILRDAFFALPVLFVFGFLVGLIQKHYRFSRAVFLCAGFFFAQAVYNVLTATVSEHPAHIQIIHAVPIVLLFIYFSKKGYSVKSKMRFRRIGKTIESEEEK